MLHTLKGGYIVGILIGDTLFQGIGIHHLEGTSLQAYPLKYTVICRLVRLEESNPKLSDLIYVSRFRFSRLPVLGI